jgi:hypothetical protein
MAGSPLKSQPLVLLVFDADGTSLHTERQLHEFLHFTGTEPFAPIPSSFSNSNYLFESVVH